MITSLIQPDQWVSVYDKVEYSFTNHNEYSGTYTMSAHSIAGQYKITVGINIGRFIIGDVILLSKASPVALYYGTVVSKTTTEIMFTATLPAGYETTGLALVQYPFKKERFMLKVGYRAGNDLADDRPLSEYAIFTSTPFSGSLNQHTLDISGYLRKVFTEIQVPVVGVDKSLFIHYQLWYYINDTDLVPIGEIKYGANGAYEKLGTSLHATDGLPLNEVQAAYVPDGSGIIQTRILGENVINELVSTAILSNPVISSSAIMTKQFTLTWPAVTSASGYKIDVATDAGFTSLIVSNVDMGNVLTHNVTGLTTRTTYYARIRAYNIYTTSGNSNTSTVLTDYYPETLTLNSRINADGGVVPDINTLNLWYKLLDLSPSGNLIPSVRVDNLALLPQYKLSGAFVSKLYSTNSSGDLVQSTTSRQPLLLPYAGIKYLYAGLEKCAATIPSGFNAQGILEIVSRIKVVDGGLGIAMGSGGTSYFALALARTGTNTYTVNWLFGTISVVTTGLTITDNSIVYFKISQASYGTDFFLHTSPDGTTWTQRGTRVFAAFAGSTLDAINLGSAMSGAAFINTAGTTGNEFYSGWYKRISAPGTTVAFDFSSFDQATSRAFSCGAFNFTIGAKSGANPATKVINQTTVCFDGSDDKITSGAFTNLTGKSTTYALIDFGSVNSGTRYFINAGSDNIVVYTDGTNVFVGDSAHDFNMGALPLGRRLLTFVKDGASSFAQFNQTTGTTSNGGTLQPTSLTLGGRVVNDTQNTTTCEGSIYHADGAHGAILRAYIQNGINNLLTVPLW